MANGMWYLNDFKHETTFLIHIHTHRLTHTSRTFILFFHDFFYRKNGIKQNIWHSCHLWKKNKQPLNQSLNEKKNEQRTSCGDDSIVHVYRWMNELKGVREYVSKLFVWCRWFEPVCHSGFIIAMNAFFIL